MGRGRAPNLFPITYLHNGHHKSENNLICNVDVVSRAAAFEDNFFRRRDGLTSKCNLRRAHFRENIKPERNFHEVCYALRHTQLVSVI